VALARGIPNTGVAQFDQLALQSEEFEGFLERVSDAGFDIKSSTSISPSNPAYFKPGNMTFYYNPESMTYLDMLHENVHLKQFLNAGNFHTGGGIGAQYELGAYSFEYQLGLEHGFSSEYMSYLETMIKAYGGL
jgi:hypothetical protein